MNAYTKNEIQFYSKAKLPTRYGEFDMFVFKEGNLEHSALVIPWESEPVAVRIHSKCETGEIFDSKRCDCKEQLHKAMVVIGKNGGVLLYLDQEGRGIGLGNKIRAYSLQQQGYDTVEANLMLGFPEDSRSFIPAAAMLKYVSETYRSIFTIKLLTNNPKKIEAMADAGFDVKRVPILGKVNPHNEEYLLTKQKKMGHILGLEEPSMKRDYLGFLKRVFTLKGRKKEKSALAFLIQQNR